MPGLSETGGADVAPPPAEALEARIEALADLSIADLRQAWAAVWGTTAAEGSAAAASDARHRLEVAGRAPRRLLAIGRAAARGARGGLPAERCTKGERAPTAAERLRPGSRLIRVWKAEQHEVEVTETGYLWRGRSWASLSSVAREITGTRRNGPAFFGLRDGDAP